MKNLIIALLLLTSTSVLAQKDIDGVMGIKFGSTKQIVMEIAKDKGGKIQQSDNANVLEYNELSFGGKTAYKATFRFIDDKFYEAVLSFRDIKEPQTIAIYEDILENLTKVYGESIKKRIYRGTFEGRTGIEAFAIRQGYATINDSWLKNSNEIVLTLTDKMVVNLMYKDGKLSDVANKGKKAIDDY